MFLHNTRSVLRWFHTINVTMMWFFWPPKETERKTMYVNAFHTYESSRNKSRIRLATKVKRQTCSAFMGLTFYVLLSFL